MKKLAVISVLSGGLALPVSAETRAVFLEQLDGTRIEIAAVRVAADGGYTYTLRDDAFGDHFLSMRPFKCVESPEKLWCHVPYPYEIKRNISNDLTDLEYDFLFVWKNAGEYGINLWNGVYYKLEETEGGLRGTMLEMDMEKFGIPPDAGELRPIKASDLHESDPDSHWLPRLVIE